MMNEEGIIAGDKQSKKWAGFQAASLPHPQHQKLTACPSNRASRRKSGKQ